MYLTKITFDKFGKAFFLLKDGDLRAGKDAEYRHFKGDVPKISDFIDHMLDHHPCKPIKLHASKKFTTQKNGASSQPGDFAFSFHGPFLIAPDNIDPEGRDEYEEYDFLCVIGETFHEGTNYMFLAKYAKGYDGPVYFAVSPI